MQCASISPQAESIAQPAAQELDHALKVIIVRAYDNSAQSWAYWQDR
jgi:hypothetical protein